jgi:hypothetical protein
MFYSEGELLPVRCVGAFSTLADSLVACGVRTGCLITVAESSAVARYKDFGVNNCSIRSGEGAPKCSLGVLERSGEGCGYWCRYSCCAKNPCCFCCVT